MVPAGGTSGWAEEGPVSTRDCKDGLTRRSLGESSVAAFKNMFRRIPEALGL
jgi:hypothetical protein